MKMLLLLLCLPGVALAAGGAWQASSIGPGLQNRGMQAASPALTASEAVDGSITEVAWRYVVNGPVPSGMMVHLCAETRCVALDGASGATRGLSNLAANQSLHFVYGVQGKGRLNRDLRVISNQVMVNYH
ncbi:flagellar protein FlhE [Erwinia billingiae]|uniref:flagellar protein FlhE n=1 Tax=Erwinia billingiae TaxID=182337 RepID=UPI0022464396|nr:flagellar protein FlhE [Erwinia billingiae]MCX0500607.1 flagellar protein FlhE [Erwinia billingiae]